MSGEISNAPPSFAALLRRYRRGAGLTQEALAERAGVSARTVSDLERGVYRVPHRDTIDLLAAALGLTARDRAALEGVLERRRGPAARVQEGAARGPAAQAARDARVAGPPGPFDALLASGTSGLPAPLTRLIGREREVAEIARLLVQTDVRLVTLLGPAGVGKTRLGLHVAEHVRASFPDGAVLVSLAPIANPEFVAPAIAQALGLRETGSRLPTQAVAEALQGKRLLLVLDNFEQVLEAALVVGALAVACPHLKLLVTSRAALRLRGERRFPVPPLPVPDPDFAVLPDQLAASEAVQLFVERAQDVAPDFTLSTGDAAAVAEICRRLDGLPLAIELAAARSTLLTPDGILVRLERRLPLPGGGPLDLPDRHQTLRRAIAWSYDLLSAAEQALFRQLAVFAGTCTPDAAAAVCSFGARAGGWG